MDELTNFLLESSGFGKIASTPMVIPAQVVPQQTMLTPVSINPPKPNRHLQELSMWQTWKGSGYKSEHLTPLMKSLEPSIRSKVNVWKAANVPTDLINIRARQLTVEALKTYSPDIKGRGGKIATPSTHVTNHLKRLERFVVENQNFGRVQERRAGSAKRNFNESYAYLRETLGRDPNSRELSEEMTLKLGKPMSVRQVEMFIKEERKDRSGADESFTHIPTDTRIMIKLLPEELTPAENQVFERTEGLNGCRKMRPGEIAVDLKISKSRVSRIRNRINEKAQLYL
jgi:DNA-binding CsgD family transcriptional regulator